MRERGDDYPCTVLQWVEGEGERERERDNPTQSDLPNFVPYPMLLMADLHSHSGSRPVRETDL